MFSEIPEQERMKISTSAVLLSSFSLTDNVFNENFFCWPGNDCVKLEFYVVSNPFKFHL